jgi:hypothetical protein
MMKRLIDLVAAGVVTVGAPLFRTVGNWSGNYPTYLRQADRVGVQWRTTHYYHPTYANADLPEDVSQARELPGLDLHEDEQLQLLATFDFQSELAGFAASFVSETEYCYDNDQYSFGDADALYSMIRSTKPARVFEIGSGNSTRVVFKAIRANKADDPAYGCRHLCIEPYEMPWLERLGPEILRKRVEDVPLALFSELEAGDILLIDSSHVIRPFGDVLTEFQSIIPKLAGGVLVHVHDIFTPRDYPEAWLRRERRLWNEQYLLEVMLAHSQRYRTVLSLNWMAHKHPEAVARALPIMAEHPTAQPGAFWFKVVE